MYAAGACPLDEAGDVVAPGDVAAQAERVVRNLEQALRAAECGLVDVVKTTVYVASSERADLVAAWNVVRAAFGDHDPPSTLLGVAVLGYPDRASSRWRRSPSVRRDLPGHPQSARPMASVAHPA